MRTMADDELNEFIPLWLREYLDKLPEADRAEFLAKYRAGVEELLKRLEDLPANEFGAKQGKFSARIPGTKSFVNLTDLVWTTAKLGGPVALATVFAPALLVHLGIVVTHPATMSTVGSSVAALYKAFASLNADEFDTYKAVAAAIERNANKQLANKGADVSEIQTSFELDEELMPPPQDLEPMLAQLEGKKVIKSKVLGGVNQYFLCF
jgi:hypothetical protein